MNQYFYIDADGKQKGTYSIDELKYENIRRDTLVWTQNMEQWKRAEEVDELRFLFDERIAPPPTAPAASESQQVEPMPKNWILESILVTILPFILCGSFLSLIGIVAIVYATQVESHYNRGDYSKSLEASRLAGRWTRISLWVFIAWTVLLIVFLLLLFLLGIGMSSFENIYNI